MSNSRDVMSIGSILNQGSARRPSLTDSIAGSDHGEASSPTTSEEGDLSKFSKKDGSKPKHKRCKTGCQTCRNRRVKCDEAKPRCNRCTSSKMKCCGTGYQHPADMAKAYRPWQPSYISAKPGKWPKIEDLQLSEDRHQHDQRQADLPTAQWNETMAMRSPPPHLAPTMSGYRHSAVDGYRRAAMEDYTQGRRAQQHFMPGFQAQDGGMFGAGHMWTYKT